jgi:hypothetical protein
MSKADDLRDVLDQTAKEIARLQNNPRTWLSWLVYLLVQLEEKSNNENPASKGSYNEMLAALQDAIRNRLNTGGWN